MTFFQLLRLRRGIRELVIPKRLCKVNCVEAESRSGGDTSGDYIESLKLGRDLRDLFDPQAGHSKVSSQLKEVKCKHPTFGLEFVRELDRAAFGVIIIIPPAASLIFAMVWMTFFLVRGKDPQATIATTFTVAAYLVTAGALIIALLAYFDTKLEDEDPRAMFKEILSQRRARENAQPPIMTDVTGNQLQPVLEELRNIVVKLPTVDERRRDINGICAEIKSGFVAQSAAIAEQKTAIDSLNESIKNVSEQQNEFLASLRTVVDDSLLTQSIIHLNSKMGQVLSIQWETAGILQKYIPVKPIQPREDGNDPSPIETSSKQKDHGIDLG